MSIASTSSAVELDNVRDVNGDAPRIARRLAVEERTVWVYPRPLTFEEWLETGSKEEHTELIDGTLVEKSIVQLDHEKLNLWLLQVLGLYIQERDLGIVLGSRLPIRINDHRGRMPDLFFVRKDRMAIVGQKATTDAPDLIMEIISPGDRPSDVVALETDYCSIGAGEIVFIDRRRARIRILRQQADSYVEEEMASGSVLALTTLDGLSLEVDWLLDEATRPTVRSVLARLLGETDSAPQP